MITTLARYKISGNLTNLKFNYRYSVIFESLQTLRYEHYVLEPASQDNAISESKEARLKLVIPTWILSHLDAFNARRTMNHLTLYSSGLPVIHYNPHRLWKFLNNHHYNISESRLNLVSKALHDLKQPHSDTVSTCLDQFESVLAEF